MLKASAASAAVVLTALEVQIVEEAAQTSEEQPGAFSENEYDASWSPSWVMWLGLPRYLPRAVLLPYTVLIFLTFISLLHS